MLIPAYQVLPYWKDIERTVLDYAIRIYPVEEWNGDKKEVVEKVEIYTVYGIERYILDNEKLIPDIELGETATYLNVTKGGRSEGRNGGGR